MISPSNDSNSNIGIDIGPVKADSLVQGLHWGASIVQWIELFKWMMGGHRYGVVAIKQQIVVGFLGKLFWAFCVAGFLGIPWLSFSSDVLLMLLLTEINDCLY